MKSYLTGLQHIGIPTKDYSASIDFYKTIGFELVYETTQPNGKPVGFLNLGNLQMEVYDSDEIAGKTGAIDHVAIDCKNIDSLFARAKELGLDVVQDEIEELDYWDKGVRFFHVLGVNKERVEFCEKIS